MNAFFKVIAIFFDLITERWPDSISQKLWPISAAVQDNVEG